MTTPPRSPLGPNGIEYVIVENEERSRFELIVSDAVAGFCEFEWETDAFGDVVVLPHTVIDPSMRGHGFAGILVRHVLDDLGGRDARVEARCWFVAEFIAAHPEYRPLLGT